MADIVKPLLGKKGWNVAFDAVVDKVNAHNANPLVAATVTTTGAAVDSLLTVSATSPFGVATKSLSELIDTTPVTAADIGAAPALTPTATKTGAYTAVSGDLVVCNATTAAFTVTLPAAAAGKVVGVRKGDTSANAVTIAAAGADTIGVVNPVATKTLPTVGNMVLVGIAGGWVEISVGASVATLDGRFLAKPTSPAATSTVTVTSGGAVSTAPLRDVREYTASASNVSTPTGILGGYITCISGGGGGGSGRKGAAATVRCGGGAGGTGIAHEQWIPAAAWGVTYTVAVGAGGAGGAAVTANDTSGSAGGAGGTSTVSTGSLLVRSSGTIGGAGGTAAAGAGGVGGTGTASATGGSASVTGGAATAPSSPAGFTPGVGAGGGGITTADVAGAGAAGSSNLYAGGTGIGGAGGAVGAATPTAGGSLGGGLPGGGGGSGAASITGNAQDGAAGGNYGGSGAGGGAAVNGVGNSGAGGAGAPGFVRVTFIYG